MEHSYQRQGLHQQQQDDVSILLSNQIQDLWIRVNPKIEVSELTLDIPALEYLLPRHLIKCEGLLLCSMGK